MVKLKSGKEVNPQPITKPQALELLGRLETTKGSKQDYIALYDACKYAKVDPEDLTLGEILELGMEIYKQNVLSELDKKK